VSGHSIQFKPRFGIPHSDFVLNLGLPDHDCGGCLAVPESAAVSMPAIPIADLRAKLKGPKQIGRS
jgi:hypothetical protein